MGVFVFFGCPVQVVDQSEHKQEERKDLAAGEMTFLFGIGNTLAIWGKASEIKKHGHVIHQLASKKTNPEKQKKATTMEEVDKIILLTLRQLGTDVEDDVTSLTGER